MIVPRSVQDFQNCLLTVKLRDMQCNGLFFTLNNNRSVGYLAKLLDEVLIIDAWATSFPELCEEFYPLISLIIVQVCLRLVRILLRELDPLSSSTFL